MVADSTACFKPAGTSVLSNSRPAAHSPFKVVSLLHSKNNQLHKCFSLQALAGHTWPTRSTNKRVWWNRGASKIDSPSLPSPGKLKSGFLLPLMQVSSGVTSSFFSSWFAPSYFSLISFSKSCHERKAFHEILLWDQWVKNTEQRKQSQLKTLVFKASPN